MDLKLCHVGTASCARRAGLYRYLMSIGFGAGIEHAAGWDGKTRSLSVSDEVCPRWQGLRGAADRRLRGPHCSALRRRDNVLRRKAARSAAEIARARIITLPSMQRARSRIVGYWNSGDVDCFNIAYVVRPESFEDIVAHIVPEVQRPGAYRMTYKPGTFCEKLFGEGLYLPKAHAAEGYRDIEAVKQHDAGGVAALEKVNA